MIIGKGNEVRIRCSIKKKKKWVWKRGGSYLLQSVTGERRGRGQTEKIFNPIFLD